MLWSFHTGALQVGPGLGSSGGGDCQPLGEAQCEQALEELVIVWEACLLCLIICISYQANTYTCGLCFITHTE